MSDDIETRVRNLERLVASLGETVLAQAKEIERLRADVSWEQTQRAVAELYAERITPWPQRTGVPR